MTTNKPTIECSELSQVQTSKLLKYAGISIYTMLVLLVGFGAQDVYSRIQEVEKKTETLDVIEVKLQFINDKLDSIQDCCRKE